MKAFSVNANIHEYVFARMIEDYNIAARNTDNSLIMASDGRELHRQWLDAMAETMDKNGLPYTPETVPKRLARDTMATVLGPAFSNIGQNLTDAGQLYRMQESYIQEWTGMTGIGLTAEARAERDVHGMKFSDAHCIPCSPFDEQYAGRETVLKQGTKILYRKPEDMFVAPDSDGNQFLFEVDRPLEKERQRDSQFYEMVCRKVDGNGRAPVDTRTGVYDLKPVGSVVTMADAAGITPLISFMSDKEFRVASRWMETVPESDRLSSDMLDRAVAILHHLDDSGVKYSIRPDQNPGQLKAVIGNTKMSIRLTDIARNSAYIGRTYNDGNSFYLSAYSSTDKSHLHPTIEHTLSLVDYGLGHSIDRQIWSPYGFRAKKSPLDGKVGELSTRTWKNPDGSSHESRTTYLAPRGSSNGLCLDAFFGTEKHPDSKATFTSNGRMMSKALFMNLRSSVNHSKMHMNFSSSDAAETFLSDAVQSARSNFGSRVNVDYLIEEHHGHDLEAEPDYIPVLSGDAAIAPIQLMYWNVLRGKSTLVQLSDMMPDVEQVPDDETVDMDTVEDEVVDTSVSTHGSMKVYVGTPEDMVRTHLNDNMDALFGQYEPDAAGKRFNPSLVAQYMESAHGVPRNRDNIVAAMDMLGWTGDEIRGDDFETAGIRDKLLRFDVDSARPMVELAKEEAERTGRPSDMTYVGMMLQTIVGTLRETACQCDENDVLIDANGVVHYSARMAVGKDVSTFVPLEGQIGQIFIPDEDGLVETHYNGSKNKLFTPGYEAYLAPQPEGKTLPVEERFRFRGLPQVLVENIQSRIRYDVMNVDEEIPTSEQELAGMVLHTGLTTSVNNTYRGLYHTGYKVVIEPEMKEDGHMESLKETYMRQMAMTQMPEDTLHVIFQTNRGMVHFPKDLIEESSVNAEYRYDQRMKSLDSYSVHSITNDNVRDLYLDTGRTNFAITADRSEGLFDKVMTGSGKNQGAIRYFVRGAGVDIDGKPIFAENKEARAPVLSSPFMRFADNIPADRQQMALANLMSGSGVCERVGVAFLTAGGYTYDDGAVISKAFADSHPQLDGNGQLRPLMPGDKICDMSGNKSIIGLVVDPDMDAADAKEHHLTDLVKLFKDNPELSVVQSPYSPCSRFNAAAARFALDDHAQLQLPDGREVAGGIAYMPMTITHHTAEDHTKSYDDDDVKQGRGRKISAQQGWMFCAKGATALMAEYFGPNSSPIINTREYLNTLGWDFDEVGTMRFGYQPHHGESRYEFKMPDEDMLRQLEPKDFGSLFADTVGSRGGFMELPFPLDMMAKGQTLQPMVGEDGTPVTRNDHPMYALPVMSAHLRSGQTFEDGTKTTHDYTNQYQTIYECGVKYLDAERILHDETSTDSMRADAKKIMSSAQQTAQQSYNGIMDDVYARIFDSKHNIFRDSHMARRMSRSATAVWTPLPDLDLNQVAMPSGLADKIGVKEGDRVLVARDPLLRSYGMRYMDVVINDGLHGVAVNPAIAVSFDGDFDGDSVAIQAVQTPEAQREAYRLFSFDQNMLDFSRMRDNGDFALMFNDSMDIISNEWIDDQRYAKELEELAARCGGVDTAEYKHAVMFDVDEPLRETRMRIEHEFNEVYRDDTLTDAERSQRNRELMSELSDYARRAFAGVGTEALSFESPSHLLGSLVDIVDHKAKGSMGKLCDYMKYAGFTADRDTDGRILVDTVHDGGVSLATMQEIRDVEKATAIKAHCTGNAGAISQKMVSVARNYASEFVPRDELFAERDAKLEVKPTEHPAEEMAASRGVLDAVLRVSYLATQGILQAKHDAEKAKVLQDKVQTDLLHCWAGYSMKSDSEKDGTTRWTVQYDNGKPKMATTQEWEDTFRAVLSDKNGLDLGGKFTDEDLHKIATFFSDGTGHMLNMTGNEVVAKIVSPMDQLAYYSTGGRARDVLDGLADAGRSLYEGSASFQFAPDLIRRNARLIADGSQESLDKLRAIQPADTRKQHTVIDMHKGAIDLSAHMDASAFKGRDVVGSGVFEPAVQASASGKSLFNYSAPILEHDVAKEEVKDVSVGEPTVKAQEAVAPVVEPKAERRLPAGGEVSLSTNGIDVKPVVSSNTEAPDY